MSDDEPSTSVSLLQRACSGQDDSWRNLAQIYGPVVYGWARRSGCQSADAADLMQETFVSVAKALPGFNYQREDSSFRGWLWTILRNKMRDRNRRATEVVAGGTDAMIAFQQIEDLPEDSTPPTDYVDDAAGITSRSLELLRSTFDPRTWKMFWETAVEHRSPDDVAAEMGVSRWAVYKARARVLARLRRDLEGLEPSV